MLVPRLGDHPAAAEHLPLAARLPIKAGSCCCHVLSAAGKAKEGKISLSPWPWEECWCPSRLCHGVYAVLVAALGWQGCECLTMAEIELYSRYPVPHQISKLGKFGTTSVPEQTWGQPVVQKPSLPDWPSLQPAVEPGQHSTSGSSPV